MTEIGSVLLKNLYEGHQKGRPRVILDRGDGSVSIKWWCCYINVVIDRHFCSFSEYTIQWESTEHLRHRTRSLVTINSAHNNKSSKPTQNNSLELSSLYPPTLDTHKHNLERGKCAVGNQPTNGRHNIFTHTQTNRHTQIGNMWMKFNRTHTHTPTQPQTPSDTHTTTHTDKQSNR